LTPYGIHDRRLRERLIRLRSDHEDHWSYGDRGAITNRAALFQYPAMMVADMQRDLMATLLDQSSNGDGPVFDPFVGSGTIVGVGMALGRDVVGWDINPLAILICRVKAGPFHLGAFDEAVGRAARASSAREALEERFDNWRHWFTEDVARGLTALRRSIRQEPNPACRRFLWTCLAETVRLTSNSRTSTVKLHRRPSTQIDARPDPRDVFKRVAHSNLSKLADAAAELEEEGVLSRGWYQGDVSLRLCDSRQMDWKGPLSTAIVTSPPYGDNTSTVPYGQHSYLPLQWIDLHDIDQTIDDKYLANTYAIDRLSLGGIKHVEASDEDELRERSVALDNLIASLAMEKRDRRNRVLAFIRDLDDALDVISSCIEIGGCAAWTVGSRRVGGQLVPLAQILTDLAASYDLREIETLERDIPLHRKRMAARNHAGSTMRREHVVVLRRVGS
jgi:hypothetical protein